MDLLQVRRTILTAIAADDYLVEQFVLKGGNALELVHGIGARASVDLDFSIATDFDEPDEVATRLRVSLEDRFDAIGRLVFDYDFRERPAGRERGAPWGGYTASFKLIARELAAELDEHLEAMRRQSEVVGPSDKRSFRIEISAFEYVEGRIEAEVDHFPCYVYSLEMIVAEKLRALCQQSPEYAKRVHPTPRARDFYDIYAALTEGAVSVERPRFQELIVRVFEAKTVDLSILGRLEAQREFHRTDWPSVQGAVRKSLRDFDYYFDYVIEEVRTLEPLWIEQSPP